MQKKIEKTHYAIVQTSCGLNRAVHTHTVYYTGTHRIRRPMDVLLNLILFHFRSFISYI